MTGCKHFWKISGQDGPTSKGVCHNCGATKEFMNSLPGQHPPKGTVSMSQNAKGHYTIPFKHQEKLVRRPRLRADLNESGSSFDDAVKIVEG